MRIVGIITEYNPFHNGHMFQLRYAREVLKADLIVVAMSGNFTQRGIPAICDKHVRAEGAIALGADLVVELPENICMADTPMFAQGAVDVLNSIGCNAYVFGSEINDIEVLEEIADLMLGDEYNRLYAETMMLGLKGPEARIRVIEQLMNDGKDYSFVNNPNNLLGIFYLNAMRRSGINAEVFTHVRMGQGYFDELLPMNHEYASGTSIRNSLKKDRTGSQSLKAVEAFVPAELYKRMEVYSHDYRFCFIEDFEKEIVEAILECPKDKWDNICVNPPRETVPYEPIREAAQSIGTYEAVRNKFMEYVAPLRADRMIGWILLNHKRYTMEDFIKNVKSEYVVLALNEQKNELIKNYCSVKDSVDVKNSDTLYYKISRK